MHAGEAATQDAAVEEVAEFFADEPWEAAVLGITFIVTGLIAMAFMTFSGIQL